MMSNNIRIVFFSDSHLGFDYPVNARTNVRFRGEDFFRNHNFVLNFAFENKADLILHGGDYFFRTKIPEPIIARAYDELIRFVERGIPIVIVPGNHESSQLPGPLLTQHRMINIFENPDTFTFELKGRTINISGFPYHKHNIRDSFSEISKLIVSNRPKADLNLLMTHHAVEGVTCGPGNYTFRYNEDVIQKKDIDDCYDAVLCGHIHRHQILKRQVKGKDIPIIYSGSVERTSFAEKDETKGFYLMEYSFEPMTLSKLKFIPLATRPMLDFVMAENLKQEEIINLFKDFIGIVNKMSIMRIKIKSYDEMRIFNVNFIKENVPESICLEFSGISQILKKMKLQGYI